jgi:hypothetical protein
MYLKKLPCLSAGQLFDLLKSYSLAESSVDEACEIISNVQESACRIV